MTIFINGKQKRVPRPQLIDGLTVDEYIARNADVIWLIENERWELLPIDGDPHQPANHFPYQSIHPDLDHLADHDWDQHVDQDWDQPDTDDIPF